MAQLIKLLAAKPGDLHSLFNFPGNNHLLPVVLWTSYTHSGKNAPKCICAYMRKMHNQINTCNKIILNVQKDFLCTFSSFAPCPPPQPPFLIIGWSPVSGTIWKELGSVAVGVDMAFLVKVFHGRWVFMLQKPEAFSATSLLALLADKDASSLFLLQCHTYLPTAMFPITMVMHANPLESRTWIKSFHL